MIDRVQRLADLFNETQKAHHQAYIDTDGAEPEWPMWYADYLLPKLPDLLGASMSKSELIYLLVHMSQIQPAEAPEASWAEYYARYLLERGR